MTESRADKPLRVLLVEDEPVIRELVSSLLSDEQVEVISAGDGAEGLRLAKESAFDLILLDVILPELDGVSVCRILKGDPKTAPTPLYMLTARSKKADVELARKAGADGYIHKPFRGAELLDLVARIRAEPPAS